MAIATLVTASKMKEIVIHRRTLEMAVDVESLAAYLWHGSFVQSNRDAVIVELGSENYDVIIDAIIDQLISIDYVS